MNALTYEYALGSTAYGRSQVRRQAVTPCALCQGTNRVSVVGAELKATCPEPDCTFGYVNGEMTTYFRVRPLTVGRVDVMKHLEPGKVTNFDRVAYMCIETGIGSGRTWYESDLYRTPEAAHEAAIELGYVQDDGIEL